MKPIRIMGVALLMTTALACQQRDTASPNDAQSCTEEAKVCPDGTSVARVALDPHNTLDVVDLDSRYRLRTTYRDLVVHEQIMAKEDQD